LNRTGKALGAKKLPPGAVELVADYPEKLACTSAVLEP
jgi:hypothetical protein